MGDIFTGAINKMSGENNNGCLTVTDIPTGKVIFVDKENLVAKALSDGFLSIKNKITIAAREQGVYDLRIEHVRFIFQDEVKDYHLLDFVPENLKTESNTISRHPIFRLVKFSEVLETFFSRELELSDTILELGSKKYVNEVRHKRGLKDLEDKPYDSGAKDAKVSVYINNSSILLDMSKSRTYEDFEANSIEDIGISMECDIVDGGECELEFSGNKYKFNFKDFEDFEEYFYNGLLNVALPYYKSLM